MTYNYGSTISGELVEVEAVVPVPFNVDVASIVLNSEDASRAIQASFDGGTTYVEAFEPTYTSDGQIVFVLTFPVTHLKFTGAVADTYSILP